MFIAITIFFAHALPLLFRRIEYELCICRNQLVGAAMPLKLRLLKSQQ